MKTKIWHIQHDADALFGVIQKLYGSESIEYPGVSAVIFIPGLKVKDFNIETRFTFAARASEWTAVAEAKYLIKCRTNDSNMSKGTILIAICERP
jgi:hypothetical protein